MHENIRVITFMEFQFEYFLICSTEYPIQYYPIFQYIQNKKEKNTVEL